MSVLCEVFLRFKKPIFLKKLGFFLPLTIIMIRYFYLFLFLCCLNSLQAQPILEAQHVFQQGHYEQAILLWRQALENTQNTDDRLKMQLGIARAYRYLGIYVKALDTLNIALSLVQHDTITHAFLLNELSKLRLSQVKEKYHKQAVKWGEKAVSIARKANNPLVLAEILNHWGNLLVTEYDFEGALEIYHEALVLIEPYKKNLPPSLKPNFAFSKKEVDALCGKILINQAQTIFLIGVEDAAYQPNQSVFKSSITALESALSVATQNWSDTYRQILGLITLSQLAQKIQTQLTEPLPQLTHKAYHALMRAKTLAENLNNTTAKAFAYGYLGQLYENNKRYDDALLLTRQALFFAQQIRDQAYVSYLWYWQLGRILKAQGNQSGAIAAYQQAVKNIQPARTPLNMTDYFFDGSDEIIRETIGPVYFELADLLLRQARSVQTTKRNKLLKQARKVIEIFKKNELQDYFQNECLELQTECTDLEQIIDAETAILYPISLPDRLELLLHRRNSLTQVTIPISEKILHDQIISFLLPLHSHPHPEELTRSRNVAASASEMMEICLPSRRGDTPQEAQEFLEPAQTLYRWLINPLLSQLHDIKTLVIVPDGILRTMPFAALHDGQMFLIQQFAVAITPNFCLKKARRIKQKRTILLGGLSEAVQGFSSLPCTEYELKSLHTLYDVPHKYLINKEFTFSNLYQNIKYQDFSIIHIASHGQFSANLEDTFILTYDDKMSMAQLKGLMNLAQFKKKQPVELLTLSACETAVGDDRAAFGLAGVALQAGVQSALASLWRIDDEATPVVVIEFYRQLQNPALSKAEALQNAMKMILTNKDYVRYRHPYYWATFLLIGNWF